MVAIFIAIYALGKAKPEHVLSHVSTIVEYLNIKCTSHNDNLIVQYVAKILEFTVPLMKSASSSIIYSLEGSLTKLLLVSGQLVIHSSIACLSAVIRLSKNTKLVKEVFIRYHCESINDGGRRRTASFSFSLCCSMSTADLREAERRIQKQCTLGSIDLHLGSVV